jgi:hypothetical protein
MNAPATGQKRLVIVGATGMVGGYALRYALDHPAVGRVTAIGRRKLGLPHPKLEVLHRDFADCSALAETLSGQDAAIFCLGTYTGSVPDAELRKITVDYTIEFARVLHGSSPDAAFRGAAKGTDLELPVVARSLPGVSSAVPQPGDTGRRLGPRHGGRRCPETRETGGLVLENRDIRAIVE